MDTLLQRCLRWDDDGAENEANRASLCAELDRKLADADMDTMDEAPRNISTVFARSWTVIQGLPAEIAAPALTILKPKPPFPPGDDRARRRAVFAMAELVVLFNWDGVPSMQLALPYLRAWLRAQLQAPWMVSADVAAQLGPASPPGRTHRARFERHFALLFDPAHLQTLAGAEAVVFNADLVKRLQTLVARLDEAGAALTAGDDVFGRLHSVAEQHGLLSGDALEPLGALDAGGQAFYGDFLATLRRAIAGIQRFIDARAAAATAPPVPVVESAMDLEAEDGVWPPSAPAPRAPAPDLPPLLAADDEEDMDPELLAAIRDLDALSGPSADFSGIYARVMAQVPQPRAPARYVVPERRAEAPPIPAVPVDDEEAARKAKEVEEEKKRLKNERDAARRRERRAEKRAKKEKKARKAKRKEEKERKKLEKKARPTTDAPPAPVAIVVPGVESEEEYGDSALEAALEEDARPGLLRDLADRMRAAEHAAWANLLSGRPPGDKPGDEDDDTTGSLFGTAWPYVKLWNEKLLGTKTGGRSALSLAHLGCLGKALADGLRAVYGPPVADERGPKRGEVLVLGLTDARVPLAIEEMVTPRPVAVYAGVDNEAAATAFGELEFREFRLTEDDTDAVEDAKLAAANKMARVRYVDSSDLLHALKFTVAPVSCLVVLAYSMTGDLGGEVLDEVLGSAAARDIALAIVVDNYASSNQEAPRAVQALVEAGFVAAQGPSDPRPGRRTAHKARYAAWFCARPPADARPPAGRREEVAEED